MSSELRDLRTAEPRMSEDEYERRMIAARRRAQWELGYEEWADVIIGAFMDPHTDYVNLKKERGDE